MKRQLLFLAILLAFGALAVAQETTPSGTHASPNEPNAVRPTKKHHRGNKVKSAPGDEGRGAKAAGHDIKTGHPVEAAKSIGEGTGRAARDVGKGTATETKEGADKTKHGAKKAGHSVKRFGKKVTGKERDSDDRDHPPKL